MPMSISMTVTVPMSMSIFMFVQHAHEHGQGHGDRHGHEQRTRTWTWMRTWMWMRTWTKWKKTCWYWLMDCSDVGFVWNQNTVDENVCILLRSDIGIRGLYSDDIFADMKWNAESLISPTHFQWQCPPISRNYRGYCDNLCCSYVLYSIYEKFWS
jgi:hypothetical protein